MADQNNYKERFKRLTTSLQRSLECPICLDTIKDQSKICLRGHAVCLDCLKDLTKCPTCEAPCILENFVSIKNILKDMPRFCRYNDSGCEKIVDPGGDHEALCGFRPISCTMGGCDQKMCIKDFNSHFENVHVDKIITEEEFASGSAVSSNEPKTCASTLVKSSGDASNFNTSPSPPKSPLSLSALMTRMESCINEMNIGGGQRGGVLQPSQDAGHLARGGLGRGMENRPPRSSLSEDNRDNGGKEDLDSDGDCRTSVNAQSQYPDDHLLFLGNLPRNASESDLRDLFKTYGNIVDLKIMKPNGNKKPNYGFIFFERVEAVQAVLNAKPIFFPGEKRVKLNVEKKKKPRLCSGGQGSDMRGGPSHGGQGGGFSRGGAGMRPGSC